MEKETLLQKRQLAIPIDEISIDSYLFAFVFSLHGNASFRSAEGFRDDAAIGHSI